MKFGQADFGVERAACFGGGVQKFAGDIYFIDFENLIINPLLIFNLIGGGLAGFWRSFSCLVGRISRGLKPWF